MATVVRRPLEGVGNIIRFNWHFYALVAGVLLALHFIKPAIPASFHLAYSLLGLAVLFSTVTSLAVSFYVYDCSPLYSLRWLTPSLPANAAVVSINAGFDEISAALAAKFPSAHLQVLDFYDPQKHTEVSIKRARRAKPAYPGTKPVATTNLELSPSSVDFVLCFLSAHEIRNAVERTQFFRQLQEALKPDGRIVVVEHLRDVPNFLAYNIGAFHFHAKSSWQQNFSSAALQVEHQQKITPFITAFTLRKHGTAS